MSRERLVYHVLPPLEASRSVTGRSMEELRQHRLVELGEQEALKTTCPSCPSCRRRP
jgi:hypothetical protein